MKAQKRIFVGQIALPCYITVCMLAAIRPGMNMKFLDIIFIMNHDKKDQTGLIPVLVSRFFCRPNLRSSQSMR